MDLPTLPTMENILTAFPETHQLTLSGVKLCFSVPSVKQEK